MNGLRDYGTEPLVWDGEPACEHDFDTEIVRRKRHTGDGLVALGARYRGGGHKASASQEMTAERGFCRHCTAWRGSLGLEPTPSLFIEHLVSVFAEVRRVLRKDGTLWVVIADSYASNTKGDKRANAQQRPRDANGFHSGSGARWATGGTWKIDPGCKPKDLVGVPWRLAFALQDDGWYLRRDIIWAKPNPMPESVEDRCTSSHEYVFHLSKSERYFYDGAAIKERILSTKGNAATFRGGGAYTQGRSFDNSATVERDSTGNVPNETSTRNKRSVWTVATVPSSVPHFATYPPALIAPCILAGTSARGVCPQCGAPWDRMVVKSGGPERQDGRVERLTKSQVSRAGGTKTGGTNSKTFGIPSTEMPTIETIGWQPTCSCNSDGKYTDPVPATVLDPFIGVGTTAIVADRLGRNCIGIELSAKYAAIAERRARSPGFPLDFQDAAK